MVYTVTQPHMEYYTVNTAPIGYSQECPHKPWPVWYANHGSKCSPHSSDSEFYRQCSSVVFPAIDCGPYPPILTGVASKSPTTYGSTVTFTCPPGYWFSRNVFTQSSRCNSNGAWTPSQMQPCTREQYSMFTAHACSSKVPLRVGCSSTHNEWTDTSLRYRHWRMCFERLLQAFARWQPGNSFDIVAQPILEGCRSLDSSPCLTSPITMHVMSCHILPIETRSSFPTVFHSFFYYFVRSFVSVFAFLWVCALTSYQFHLMIHPFQLPIVSRSSSKSPAQPWINFQPERWQSTSRVQLECSWIALRATG